MVDYAVIDAFVMSAYNDEMFFGGKLSSHRLIEFAALRRHEHHFARIREERFDR